MQASLWHLLEKNQHTDVILEIFSPGMNFESQLVVQPCVMSTYLVATVMITYLVATECDEYIFSSY